MLSTLYDPHSMIHYVRSKDRLVGDFMREPKIEPEFEELHTQVQAFAKAHRGDTYELIKLLRLLEKLHREVREAYFEPTLPNSRQALYLLLKDIEEQGGWPYIERMKLRHFIEVLQSNQPLLDDNP